MQQRMNKLSANTFGLVRYQIRKDLQRFSEIIGGPKIVLDVGSGLDKPYQNLFETNNYFGIDLFEPSDVQGDITFLPFPNQSANLVLCTEVMEHVEVPARVLKEIHRVLIPGQHFILTVPLVWGVHDYVDHQRWTEQGLSRDLKKAGFEIIEILKRGGIFSLIGLMIKHIPIQIFGEFRTQKYLFTKIIYLFTLGLTLFIPWIFYPFDKLDKQKDWVIGYSVLCKKI